MSGRHRKPTHTGLRLAKVGALTVMAMAPLTSITGTALAATPDSDHDSSSTADPDSSSWNGDGNRHSDGDEDTSSDRSEPASFDWRDSHSPRSTHHDSDDSDGSYGSGDSDDSGSGSDDSPSRSYDAPSGSDRSARDSDSISRPLTGSTTGNSTDSAALGSTSTPAALAKWDKLAQCESTQNWAVNSGNGYSGGLQFTDATWRAYGGNQYASSAHQATRLEQIAVARKVQQAQGWKAWPGCSRKLGYS